MDNWGEGSLLQAAKRGQRQIRGKPGLPKPGARNPVQELGHKHPVGLGVATFLAGGAIGAAIGARIGATIGATIGAKEIGRAHV